MIYSHNILHLVCRFIKTLVYIHFLSHNLCTIYLHYTCSLTTEGISVLCDMKLFIAIFLNSILYKTFKKTNIIMSKNQDLSIV